MIKYTLKKPIEHNGETYSELSFREALTGDVMMAERFEGVVSKAVATLAACSDTPLPAFKLIPAKELNKILDLTRDLLGNGSQDMTGD